MNRKGEYTECKEEQRGERMECGAKEEIMTGIRRAGPNVWKGRNVELNGIVSNGVENT